MPSPGSRTALGRLADLVRPPDFLDEGQHRAAGFISVVAGVTITASLLGAVFALARTEPASLTAGLLVASSAFISGALWLLRRGSLAAAGWIVFLIPTALTTALVFMGRSRGLEDIAMMLYPALVIFASVLLGRRGFVVGFALILAILSGILAAELLSHLNSWPSDRDLMVDFGHAVLIVVMSGVASYLHSLLKSIEKQRAAARALVAAAKTREELIAALEARNAELERFTYTVSHDLKSPLITIGGFLGYLEKHAESGETRELQNDLARISEAQRTMLRLLNELLQLSRVGRKIGPAEDLRFAEIVGEAQRRAEGPLRDAGRNVQRNRQARPVLLRPPATLLPREQSECDGRDRQVHPREAFRWEPREKQRVSRRLEQRVAGHLTEEREEGGECRLSFATADLWKELLQPLDYRTCGKDRSRGVPRWSSEGLVGLAARADLLIRLRAGCARI